MSQTKLTDERIRLLKEIQELHDTCDTVGLFIGKAMVGIYKQPDLPLPRWLQKLFGATHESVTEHAVHYVDLRREWLLTKKEGVIARFDPKDKHHRQVDIRKLSSNDMHNLTQLVRNAHRSIRLTLAGIEKAKQHPEDSK